MTGSSIFYDMSGRRRRRFRVGLVAFVLLLLLSAVAFAATILAVTPQRPLPFAVEHATSAAPRADFLQRSQRSIRRTARAASRLWGGAGADPNKPLVVAFHAAWDPDSASSLRQHVEQLDWLVPGWMSITGPDHHVTPFADPEGHAIIARAAHRPVVLPMVQNALGGDWDSAGLASLLRDPAARARALGQVEAMVATNHGDGVFFDFEDLPTTAQPYYRRFLAEARARFARPNRIVAIAVPPHDPDGNLAPYAQVSAKVFEMA